MKPLFPNKDQLEEDPKLTTPERKRYKINADCEYVGPQQHSTGSRLVDGDRYKVKTDAGNQVVVWVAYDQSLPDELKYFCHGHAFGTYEAFGYSLEEVQAQVFDEWEGVGKTVKVNRLGD